MGVSVGVGEILPGLSRRLMVGVGVREELAVVKDTDTLGL